MSGLTITGTNTALAQSAAFSRGQSDAACDLNNCHGHGFDPHCPAGHSADYCTNYENGYNSQWNGGGGSSAPPQTRQLPVLPPKSHSSAGWTLTVNVRNVNFGESSIAVSVRGPFGYSDHQDVPNGPSPSASFSIPGGAIPVGNRFDVCAGTGLGTLLPRCTPFIHAQDGDNVVTVSP